MFYSFVSSGNYLCHYGGAKTFIDEVGAFSDPCFNQNKNRLSRREEENRTYPYFGSSVGAPPGALRILLFAYVFLYTLYISYFVIPTVFFKLACNRHTKSSTTCMISAKLYCQVVLNFWFIGCGPLPVVKDGEWECPGDVSSLSVPVYESCHIVCKGDSAQTRALVKVRCTEKLEWDRVLTSNACSVEKSSGTLNRALSDCAIF